MAKNLYRYKVKGKAYVLQQIARDMRRVAILAEQFAPEHGYLIYHLSDQGEADDFARIVGSYMPKVTYEYYLGK